MIHPFLKGMRTFQQDMAAKAGQDDSHVSSNAWNWIACTLRWAWQDEFICNKRPLWAEAV